MRPSVAALSALVAVGSVPAALARMKFLSPPEFTGLTDPSNHPVLVIGSSLDLEWTPAPKGNKISVMLYQLNATRAATFNGQFHWTDSGEFITHDQVDATSFTWFVGTSRDLSSSPYFAIALWDSGTLVTDSATNIFNITRPGSDTSSNSSSGGSSSSGTATPATSATTGSPPTAAAASPTDDLDGDSNRIDNDNDNDSNETSQATESSGSGGLSTGAAVGVGIGAALGVVLLVGLAWYLGRRSGRRRQQQQKEDGGGPGSPGSGGMAVVGAGAEEDYQTLACQQQQNEHGNLPPEKYFYYQGGSTGGPAREVNGASAPVEVPGGDHLRHELL